MENFNWVLVKEKIGEGHQIRIETENGGVVALMKRNNGNKERNANLVAAAPDLLMACQSSINKILSMIDYEDVEDIDEETALFVIGLDDIIKKAKGLKND